MSSFQVQQDELIVDGKKIHIDLYPTRNALGNILFMHGNIVYAKSYRDFLARLSQKGNFNVIAFDYLGWGRSEGARGKAEAENVMLQINEMVKYTQSKYPDKKCAVAGHSMGGHFAFEALVENEELTCCVSHTIRYPGIYSNIADKFFANYFRFLGRIRPNKKVSPLKHIINSPSRPGKNSTYEKLLKDPKIVTTFSMKTIAELTKVRSKKNHRTERPVLIVVGEREENPNEITLAKETTKLLPNATLEIIKGGSHLVFLEKPNEAADLLIHWLHKQFIST